MFMASKLLSLIKATDKLKKGNVQEHNPKLCKRVVKEIDTLYMYYILRSIEKFL